MLIYVFYTEKSYDYFDHRCINAFHDQPTTITIDRTFNSAVSQCPPFSVNHHIIFKFAGSTFELFLLHVNMMTTRQKKQHGDNEGKKRKPDADADQKESTVKKIRSGTSDADNESEGESGELHILVMFNDYSSLIITSNDKETMEKWVAEGIVKTTVEDHDINTLMKMKSLEDTVHSQDGNSIAEIKEAEQSNSPPVLLIFEDGSACTHVMGLEHVKEAFEKRNMNIEYRAETGNDIQMLEKLAATYNTFVKGSPDCDSIASTINRDVFLRKKTAT